LGQRFVAGWGLRGAGGAAVRRALKFEVDWIPYMASPEKLEKVAK
jgi:hypothetical protein